MTSAAPSPPTRRLVIVVGGLHPGGAERQLALLLRHAPSDVHIEVCTLAPGAPLDDDVAAHVAKLHPAGGSHVQRLRVLSQVVGDVRPDAVLGWHFFTNAYAAVVARRHRRPSIGGIRGSLAHEQQMQPRLWQANLRLPGKIVANSLGAQEECLRLRRNVDYVANAVVLPDQVLARPDARARLGVPPTSRPVVALIGNHRPEKRIERFIDALALARDGGVAWHGVLIGTGPLREELERHAAGLGLGTDDLTFAGHVEDPQAVLGALDLVALTSDTEGTSNALLEAMMAGVAVLTTDVGELGRSLRDGLDGFVATRSAAAVADGLRRAADDATRAAVAAAGHERVLREHTVDAALRAWGTALGFTPR